MDWLKQLNLAMDYIENNLEGKISYDTAARLACCSTYHFQRMFSYLAGVSLSEYIRRRRLTLAGFELQTGRVKVTDTALKYGYESPEAFSRAFKKLHGVLPASVRDAGVSLKAYPKMSFSITIKLYQDRNLKCTMVWLNMAASLGKFGCRSRKNSGIEETAETNYPAVSFIIII